MWFVLCEEFLTTVRNVLKNIGKYPKIYKVTAYCGCLETSRFPHKFLDLLKASERSDHATVDPVVAGSSPVVLVSHK